MELSEVAAREGEVAPAKPLSLSVPTTSVEKRGVVADENESVPHERVPRPLLWRRGRGWGGRDGWGGRRCTGGSIRKCLRACQESREQA